MIEETYVCGCCGARLKVRVECDEPNGAERLLPWLRELLREDATCPACGAPDLVFNGDNAAELDAGEAKP